ncbi:MAG: amylo-alpha-1,6-glucosidase [Bacteroidales bacterium]|jgi:predicted glycogen debranching enzyme|nr:amylo-alpha-1,6-glucosidase [Bacteroidales bacterium]
MDFGLHLFAFKGFFQDNKERIKVAYIEFDKQKLINLEYSLQRELLRTSRTGAYASTTIVGCNTRKYHGLLVCPMENIDNDNHVMLSGLDITAIEHQAHFNFAVRKYPFVYEPKGHKYLDRLEMDAVPKFIYRIDEIELQMERILSEDDRILIKYTLLKSQSPVKLLFKPFLAFRNVHQLSKANFYADTKYKSVENGIKVRMYEGYKPVYMQFDKPVEYIHVPDWYYNIEYREEQKRGYDYKEDLYVPGYFEVMAKKGESIIFTASLNEIKPEKISDLFDLELKNRSPRNSYLDCLRVSAQQFICRRDNKTEIIAGFPWFGSWGRDTFISLPGLTLYNDDISTCKDVLDTMVQNCKDGLFPNVGSGDDAAINSADAPLWFFWTLQQYLLFVKDETGVWKAYGDSMKQILLAYRKGTHYNIKMHDNALIWQGEKGKALTWQDAVVEGTPVTPRNGFAVEINALWYNAVRFTLRLAEQNKDMDFVKKWSSLPEKIKESFIDYFWSEERNYLADCGTYEKKDYSIRPNQLFACSLPYSPLDEAKKSAVVETVRKILLTPKGIRTLSPDHPAYEGRYEGDQKQRDRAYHQGTAWVWLLGHFCEAYLQLFSKSGLELVKKIFYAFEEDMSIHGLGTVSEIYDGDPPHYPNGTISQAWSVGELLRIYHLIKQYEKQ